MKKILSLGLILIMVLGMGVMPISADSAVTITPSVASGSEIDTVCELSFEFNVDMNKDTLNSTNVVLKELIKVADTTAEPTYNNRVFGDTLASYDETTKTYTIEFEDGRLAPGNTYVIEFTTAVTTASDVALTEAISFTYTTKWGEYYINDNFSRYPVGAKLEAQSKSSLQLLPWQMATETQADTAIPAQIRVDKDGTKAMYAKVGKEGAVSAYSWGYRKDYLPTSKAYFTEHEVEFIFNGDDKATYAIWSYFFFVRKASDGNFYMYYVPYGTNTTSYASGLYGLSGLTPLFQVTEGEKTNFKFVLRRASKTGTTHTRYLYKIYKNNEEITQIVDTMGTEAIEATETTEAVEAVATTYKNFSPIRLSSYATHYFTYDSSSTSGYDNFGIAASASASAELWVYKFKYKEFDVITSTSPKNGEVNVSREQKNIVINFGLGMNSSKLSNITITNAMGETVGYTGKYASNAYTITLKTTPNYGDVYTVTLPTTIQTSGVYNSIEKYSFSFTYEDYAKVESTNLDSMVADGDIKVKFTKSVDPSALTFALQEEGIDYTDETTGEIVDAWWNRKLPAGTYDDETHTYTISFKDAPLHTTSVYRLKLTLNGTEEILGTFTPAKSGKYFINENFDLYNAATALHYKNENHDKYGPWHATTSNGNNNVLEFTSDGNFHAQLKTDVAANQYVTLKYNAESMPEVDISANDLKSAELKFKYNNFPAGGYIDIYGQILTIYKDAEGIPYLHLEGVVNSSSVDKKIAPIPENEEVTVVVNYVASNLDLHDNRRVYSIVVKTNSEENTYTKTADGIELANYNVSSQGSDCGVEMQKGSKYNLAMFSINKPASTGALTTASDLWVYEVKYSLYEKAAGEPDYDVSINKFDNGEIQVKAVELAGKGAKETVVVAAYDVDESKLIDAKVVPVNLAKLGDMRETFTLDIGESTNVKYKKFRFENLSTLKPIIAGLDTELK